MTKPQIVLSEASGVPFYRQIVDQVAQMIRSGLMPPGERLPSVRELAGTLLVSLITVRRAYADLEVAGLIIRRQGYGTFVAEKIERSSRKQALAEVRAAFLDAFSLAKRLGVDEEDLKKIMDELTNGYGDKNES